VYKDSYLPESAMSIIISQAPSPIPVLVPERHPAQWRTMRAKIHVVPARKIHMCAKRLRSEDIHKVDLSDRIKVVK
jgi:hypothetical protein